MNAASLGLIALGYLIGSVPTGLVLVRVLARTDIRRHGSGNIGAVNVLRVAGPAVAAIVLVADMLKGFAPVWLAIDRGAGPWTIVLCGLAAIAGHNWSVFLRFRGGKGIATSFGVLLGLSLKVALVAGAVWIIVVALTRYSSLGSLLAVIAVPFALWRFGAPDAYVAFGVIAMVFALYRHRGNIDRLRAGAERRMHGPGTPETVDARVVLRGWIRRLPRRGPSRRRGGGGGHVLARRAHVAAIRTRGLGIETPDGVTVCKHIDSITSLDDLRSAPDLVILTVKAYDTPEAVSALRPLVEHGARLLTLQNGVGNEERIASVVSAARTVSGAVTLSVSSPRPGDVRQNTAEGGVALAPVEAGGTVRDLVGLFRRAGFRVKAYPDYRAMKWSKLLLNMLANATSAVLDMTPAEIAGDPRAFAVDRAAFLEAVRVMRALHVRPVDLPGYPVPLLVRVMAGPAALARLIVGRRLGGGRGEKMPSLWEDLERGRRESEVGWLNGAVARDGARLGIPTLINARLTEVLEGLAAGRLDREEFRRTPEMLLGSRA